jgi:hypothetical protein
MKKDRNREMVKYIKRENLKEKGNEREIYGKKGRNR